jgi:ketosteroid isomerase-like protein
MTNPNFETVVRAFFAAMNAQDADAAAALAREDITIALGPNEFVGSASLRELALQTDDQLTFETLPLSFEPESDTEGSVSARRIQRWRATGDIAVEEDVQVRFELDPAGAIARIELG